MNDGRTPMSGRRNKGRNGGWGESGEGVEEKVRPFNIRRLNDRRRKLRQE